MRNKKDYYINSYPYKKPKKKRIGKICPICKACKDKSFCKNRKDVKLMKKCPDCSDCWDKDNCDVFYMGKENRVTIQVGSDEDGKPIFKSFNASDKAKATYRAVQFQQDVENGLIDPLESKKKSDQSVHSLYVEYLNNLYNSGGIRDNTYHTHGLELKRLLDEKWIYEPIRNVTRNQIEDFLSREREKGLSNSSLKKDFSIIKTAFEIAVERGYIPMNKNFFLGRYGIKKPKSIVKDKKVKALELDDEIKFLYYLLNSDEQHKNLFILLMNTGARIGELLALKLEDIHLDENYFWIRQTITLDKDGKLTLGENTKTENGERKVVLNELTKPILEDAIATRNPSKENLIFCQKDGKLYTNTGINSALKRAFERAGFKKDIHTHMFRHSFITRSKEAGVDVEATKTGVGHSDIHITQDVYNEDQLPYLLKQNKTYSKYIIEELNKYKEKEYSSKGEI